MIFFLFIYIMTPNCPFFQLLSMTTSNPPRIGQVWTQWALMPVGPTTVYNNTKVTVLCDVYISISIKPPKIGQLLTLWYMVCLGPTIVYNTNKSNSIMWFLYTTCSSPRCPVRSHSLVCSEKSLLIVGIGPILNKELELIFRSDCSDRTCVYSYVSGLQHKLYS